jgi:hypothetical protein
MKSRKLGGNVWVCVLVVLTACAFVLARSAPTALSAAPSGAKAPYLRTATTACLIRRGAVVGRVRPTNARLRALRDLAQKNSMQVRFRGATVGIAFGRSTNDAGLLFELLQVPKDPLRLEQLRNAVLLSPKRSTAARSAVLRCLQA